jgi:hypothetical protein
MNSKVTTTQGNAVRESCRLMLEAWLSRDIRRIMFLANAPAECFGFNGQASSRSGKQNKKGAF